LVDSLSSCPSISYILATQPGASITDFTAPGAAPHLRREIVNGTDNLKERVAVSEVYGEVDMDYILGMLLNECGAAIVHADPSSKCDSAIINYALQWTIQITAIRGILKLTRSLLLQLVKYLLYLLVLASFVYNLILFHLQHNIKLEWPSSLITVSAPFKVAESPLNQKL
jgi:hypothetical protein